MAGFRIVIPARYASTRLPGKPLLPIAGRPMIEHVHRRAQAAGAGQVVVATDDERIAGVARAFGAEVCMTRSDHPSGTDRIAEVAQQMGWADSDIVVNLQGDEPLMPVSLLHQVADDLAINPQADIATLATTLDGPEQVFDAHVVKVVTDRAGFALYFSRASIPWDRQHFHYGKVPPHTAGLLRHLGLYAYRVGFLRDYQDMAPAPIEEAESLEQLRALWYGRRIHVAEADQCPPPGVDTAEDLARVEAVLAGG